MIKAVREGKEESSWSNPNTAYEAALERFVAAVLDASRPNAFLADFYAFVAPLLRLSAIAALAQLVLKLTSPGVPDIYQGCELWDFSLVDPDNRRPPDWARRQALLARLANSGPAALTEEWPDGREKLFVTHRLLTLRRHHPDLFASGDYLPLRGEGGRGDEHLCAFARRHGAAFLVVAVPRLVYRLHHGANGSAWGATELALPSPGPWHDVLAKRDYRETARVRAGELFAEFPVAVLLGAAAPG
jgi:(1->4)-alpha-D-glucan 1-alpha-D-glucosylmutase